jgi:hypothetical protein
MSVLCSADVIVLENGNMSGLAARALEEFGKRKASLEKKHEAELNALKIRQKREMDVLELRYSGVLMGEKTNFTAH